MSSTTQDQLLRFFAEAAGTDVSETSADASSAGPGPAAGAADGESYSATSVGMSVESGAESAASTTGGAGGAIESGLTTFLEGGLGIASLVTGLMGLFGGGGSAPAQLEKYQPASSIDFVSADTPNGLAAAEYDQLGMPRLADTAVPTSTAGNSSVTNSEASGASTVGNVTGGGQSGSAMPQMTLNIQAMDSQSILDRSSDIAQAVRSAMLNMSSINDVISDL